MKTNYNMFSLFGNINKFRAFVRAGRSVFSMCNAADMLVIYNENTCQEKLQIRYANIRV
jgi:hypothetical protein